MDRVDLEIFKRLSQNRISAWDSLDPRVSAQEVADALGIDRTTVAARLRAWSRIGFLVRTEVLPNPALLGGRMAGMGVRVPDPRAKPPVLERLALLEGVVGVLDHVGEWLGVAIVWESEAMKARTLRMMSLLDGVAEISDAYEIRGQACSVVPTPVDWRILRALRGDPRAALTALADAAGLHVKTFRRRYERLIEAHAIWVVPVYDFSRYEGAAAARLVVGFDGGASTSQAARRVITALERTGAGVVGEPLYEEAPIVELFVHLPSVGDVEAAQLAALRCDHVASVEIVFPRRMEITPTWFDERLARVGSVAAR